MLQPHLIEAGDNVHTRMLRRPKINTAVTASGLTVFEDYGIIWNNINLFLVGGAQVLVLAGAYSVIHIQTPGFSVSRSLFLEIFPGRYSMGGI